MFFNSNFSVLNNLAINEMDNNKDKKEISISARDVLQHLNSLGYTEITGQQLKYFIKGKI